MAEELTVWWCGQRDHYLCIPPAEVRDLSYVKPADVVRRGERAPNSYVNRTVERAVILRTLATKPRWKVSELRALCGVSPQVFGGIVNRLIDRGFVTRLDFGVVALKRKDAA